jgi:small-conductance mechanosensitive channel
VLPATWTGRAPSSCDGSLTAVETLSARVIARYAGVGLLGIVIGVVGTAVHRSRPPLGLILALLIVLVAALFARASTGWVGMLALAMGIGSTTAVLGASGPGGDVLVVADTLGYVWYVGAAVVALAGLAPRGWFSDRPVGRSSVGAAP